MKLISCHIENFGKIHDYSIDFNDGVNKMCEENGWGKSTLAAFIQAMFYGFEGDNKRSIEGNERKKYKPWKKGILFREYLRTKSQMTNLSLGMRRLICRQKNIATKSERKFSR